MTVVTEALRDWADIHEKSVSFLDDDLAEEAVTETALLREAADRIEALERVAYAARQLRKLLGPAATLTDRWYGEVTALDDALGKLGVPGE